jgi:hypothetical protein
MPNYKTEIVSTIRETVYLEADNPDHAQELLGEGYQADETETISGLDINVTEIES